MKPKNCIQLVIMLALFASVKTGFAQNELEANFRKIYAPETRDLGRHTFTPVDLYTGQPSINIPVYTVKHYEMEIPISLSYDAGGFIPNKASTSVGLNWSLIAGGMISRTVNHVPDEMTDPDGIDQIHGGFFTVSPRTPISNDTVEYLGGGILVDGPLGNGAKEYGFQYELSPDLFVFNFAGHTGKFMMGHDGKFKVQGGGTYKIDITGLTNISYAYGAGDTYAGKIVITDQNGVIYEFGGSEAAVEFTHTQTSSGQGPRIPNAWYLTKITTPEGHEILLKYADEDESGHLGLKATNSNLTAIPVNGSGHPMVVQNVYLRTIECRAIGGGITQTVNFHNSLRSNSFSFYTNEKLDSITVRDGNDVLQKKFLFTYNDQADRLYLDAFGESGLPAYEFGYWPGTSPDLNDHTTDYWGFYNGTEKGWSTPVPNPTHDENLEMNESYSDYAPALGGTRSGILHTIKNPLGGKTEYIYEFNDYSYYYGYNSMFGWRVNGGGQTVTAGGLRVSHITLSDDNGTTQTRQYKYVLNYAPGAFGLVSSGVLARKPNFFRAGLLPMPDLLGIGEPHITYSEVVEIQSGMGYTIHKFNSIYYPDKSNITEDGASNANQAYYWVATPYPPGNPGPQWSPYAVLNFYNKKSSLALERGKPSVITHYNSSGKRVSSTSYTYNTDPNRYEDRIASVDFPAIGIPQHAINLAINALITTSNTYFFNTKPTRIDERWYDANGTTTTQVTTTRFSYNDNKQLARKTRVNSQGIEEIEKNRYIGDYTFSPSSTHPLKAMQNLHILAPLVEQQQLQKAGTTTKLISGELTTYAKWNSKNVFRPASIRRLLLDAPTADTTQSKVVADTVKAHTAYAQQPEVVFDAYSDDGQLRQFRQKGLAQPTTFVWSYAGQYPVAELRNATYAEVKVAVGSTTLANLEASLSPNISSLSNTLRGALPSAMINTHVFTPLVGIASSTDEKGQVIYYEYDAYQRLKAIKNHSGDVIKTYDYYYKQQ